MKQLRARVIENGEILPGVFLIWLEAPGIASEVLPGQFVMVRCGEDTVLPRPFSVHQCRDDRIALLVRIAGTGTEWLSRVKPGDIIEVFGPLGNGFSLLPGSKNLLLLAGGIGIAPLYFLARYTAEKNCKVTLIYGTASKDRYSLKGINTIDVTEDGSYGIKGMLTDLLPEYVDNADGIFACGPMTMYKAMSEIPELKSKTVQVSLEIMMGCGRGICYGCTIKTKNGLQKVCEDGPVFELSNILWDEMNL